MSKDGNGKGTRDSIRQTVGFVINWAWRIRVPTSPLKLLLVAMAQEANSSGVCEVPVRWLADHCNFNVRHTQKLLLQLRDLGLTTIVDLAPGTPDRSRLFALQITIDADLWTPTTGDAMNLMRRLTTNTFHERLIDELQASSSPSDAWAGAAIMNDYRTFISQICVIAVAAKRLVLRVPNKESATKVFTTYRDMILKVASELSERELKKIQVIHPQVKS